MGVWESNKKIIPVPGQAVNLMKKATDWAHEAVLGLLGKNVASGIVVS